MTSGPLGETGEGDMECSSLREGPSVFQFNWSQQGSRVLEHLRALFDNQGEAGESLGIQPDVVLFSSDGDFVEAHKMVLCLCSPYFQNLFKKISHAKCVNMGNSVTVVVLESVSSPLLKHLIQFIYTGKVTVCSDQVNEFMALGNAFKIDGVAYSTGLSSNPTTQNSVEQDELPSSVPVEVLEKLNASQAPCPTLKSESVQSLTEDHENLDIDFDISYDSYTVKVESDEETFQTHLVNGGDTGVGKDKENDVLPSRTEGREESVSSEDEESQEKDDPTYQEEMPASSSSTSKRTRKDAILSKLAVALSKAPHNPALVSDNWSVQEAPPETTFKQHWAIRKTNQSRNQSSVTYYYCRAGGRSCPFRLKKTTLKDGRVIWCNNEMEHGHHSRTPQNLVVRNDSWSVQEAPSEQSLIKQWSIYGTKQSKNQSSVSYYYCRVGGRRCPVRLKRTTLKDGRVIWQCNKMVHANHSKNVPLVRRGLTSEQKEFVLKCVQGGVTSPLEIFRRFEAIGKVPPCYSQIKSLLGHARQRP